MPETLPVAPGPSSSSPPLSPEVVDVVARMIARRYRLRAQDVDDIRSALWVKLLDRDGDVLRRFAGRSALTTYLMQVGSRLLLDRQADLLGRWRPTATVKRLGPAAVAWARLVERDGCPPDEALRMLRSERRFRADDLEAVDALRDQAAPRPYCPRRFVDLTELRSIDTSREMAAADTAVCSRALRRVVAVAVRAAFRALTPDERRLILLRFRDGLRISEVARREQRPPSPLYRQYGVILRRMRDTLLAAGVDAATVASALEQPSIVASSLGQR